jgi:hypothetical protein
VLKKRDMRKLILIGAIVVLGTPLIFLFTPSPPHAIAVGLERYEENGFAHLAITNCSTHDLRVWPPIVEVKAGHGWTNYWPENNEVRFLRSGIPPGDEGTLRRALPQGSFTWRARIPYQQLEKAAWKGKVNQWLKDFGLPSLFQRRVREYPTGEYQRVGE